MKNSETVRIAAQSLLNRTKGWPICVSFEVTHSCVADCVHCDKGGVKQEIDLMSVTDYRRYSQTLKPGLCQMSGGEPLMRADLEDIIRAIKRPGGLPMVVCVSNFWLMTEERYLSLNRAGVSLFSISLDFPDERHDDFRRLPGLFAKMSELIPHLVRTYGRENIVLNSALTHANFAEIPGLVAKAEEWGTQDLLQRLQQPAHRGPEPVHRLPRTTWPCCVATSTISKSTSAGRRASSTPTTSSTRPTASSPRGE